MAAIRTQREIRQRAPWWLFGLLALNFALMTYDARRNAPTQQPFRSLTQSIVYPIQRGASGFGNWVGGLFGGVGHLRRASAENEQLRAQIEHRQSDARGKREEGAQAHRLQKRLQLSEQSQCKRAAAQVIPPDPPMWFDGISID